jgi:NAD-dependent deacetylase
MLHLVILTGAGISAESGLKTFRGHDGLWEGYNIMEVATPEAWRKNPNIVLEFYNMRRKAAMEAVPNAAHKALADAEKDFKISIITQNVDDLHERAGSTNVLHLHGQLNQSRSTLDPTKIYPINGWELNPGDKCPLGSQLRPNIVWFGEAVPKMDDAIKITATADIFLVIGTSLQVYPAAGLIYDVPRHCPIYLVDPSANELSLPDQIITFPEKASTGVIKALDKIMS